MKFSIRLLFLFFIFFMLSFCSNNSKLVKGNIYKISNKIDFKSGKFAIFPFKSSSEGKTFSSRIATDGNAIADILTIQMLYKGYNIIEREKLDKILEEKSISQSGLTETEDSYKNLGKLLGVDFIIYGSVIQYDYTSEQGKWYISLGVTARVIHVVTGKVVMICSANSHGEDIGKTLHGISLAITDALMEDKIYVWE